MTFFVVVFVSVLVFHPYHVQFFLTPTATRTENIKIFLLEVETAALVLELVVPFNF